MNYAAFLLISLLVICTPGQDTALTIRNTLLGGRRGGVATAVGVACGQAVWTLATSAGLAVVLAASGPLFLWIRLVGAAYLVYLGARSLVHAWSKAEPAQPRASRHERSFFWQGLLSNLSNAKMVAFFISLLPQFTGPHASFLLLTALGLNFCLLTLAWLTAYAFAVEKMKGLLIRNRVRRAIDAVLGAVLLGLGLRVTQEAIA